MEQINQVTIKLFEEIKPVFRKTMTFEFSPTLGLGVLGALAIGRNLLRKKTE